jgi:hypothetical protein
MQGKNGEARLLNEEAATQVAAAYIAATFGSAFSIHTLHFIGTTWWVRIQCQHPEMNGPVVVGSVQIDALSGQIAPLTMAEISDIRERAMLLAAHHKGELARDHRGYILPSQAKVKVTGYIAEHIAFFATAEDQPEWVESTPPLWRVATALRLRGQGKVCELGTVDVNSLTGDVLPLSDKEISLRQKRARHAAETVTPSAATTS